jgi:hypothetical protein
MGTKRGLLITIACLAVPTAAIVCFGALPIINSTDKSGRTVDLQKNVVSSELGDFAYANGRMKLITSKTESGDITLRIQKRQQALFRTATHQKVQDLKIPTDCQWFYALDDLERLWLFIGPKEYVKETSRDAVFVVYLFGHVIGQNGKAKYSIQNVTGTKDGVGLIGSQVWHGVPEQFLAELHRRMAEIPLVKASLPDVPPTFTEQQVSQLITEIEN